MSGDSTALEVEEETSLLDLVATQSEEEVDDIADGELPDSVEELQALLTQEREIKSKRNRSLKKAKEAQHRTQEEYNTLLQRFDAIEGKLSQQPKPGAEKLEQEAQTWRDRVEDDPTQVVGMVDWQMGQLEDRIARFLGDKFSGIESKMSEWQGATNPERREYASKIEILKQNPDFAALDDDALLVVAKALGGKKVKEPRGSVKGGRAVAAPDKPDEISEADLQLIKEAVRSGM